MEKIAIERERGGGEEETISIITSASLVSTMNNKQLFTCHWRMSEYNDF